VPGFPLTVGGGSIVATRLRPAADGRGWILRLYNASSKPEKLVLSGQAVENGRVLLSDLDGTPGAPFAAPLELPAFGILTLLIR
jgi:alpha-mannosidase